MFGVKKKGLEFELFVVMKKICALVERMKYCENCSYATDAARCPLCGGKHLREVEDDDYCFLIEKPKLEGEMLADVLRGNGIGCVAVPSGSGVLSAMALPLENRKLFVRWKDWKKTADMLYAEEAADTEMWRQFLQENAEKFSLSPKTEKRILRKAKLGKGGDALRFCRRMIAQAKCIDGGKEMRFSREQLIFCHASGVVVTVNAKTLEIVSVSFEKG